MSEPPASSRLGTSVGFGWSRHLRTGACAALGGTFAEAAVSAFGTDDPLRVAAVVAAFTAPFAAVLGGALALLLRSSAGDASFAESVSSAARRSLRDPANPAARLATGAGAFAASYVAIRAWFARLHNQELAAFGAVATALGLLLAARGLEKWIQRRTPRVAVGIAIATTATVVTWLAFELSSSFAQLDPRLAVPPLAFATAAAVADAFLPGGRRARPSSALVFGVLLALPLGLAAVRPGFEDIARFGRWSRGALVAARWASDFDRDGASSWFGGRDCAPFDAAVHPGARDVPGNGIDENCSGADAEPRAGAAPSRPVEPPAAVPANLNLVVVTIETFRHDHASFNGYARDTTPELARVARDAFVFERMYATAPMTRLSLASLWSSRMPSSIEWLPQARDKRMRRIGPETPWLPERLARAGYRTEAVLTNFRAFTELESAGFERGFERYDTTTELAYRGGTMWGFPAAAQIDRAIAALDSKTKPFLLWVHLFEPHYVYEQPPGAPHFGDDEQSRYDAEIWHVDHELGRLFRALRERNSWDSTVLLVTGDHGEAFGEHGDRWHGANLFDPQVRPAALLRVPGLAGRRVAEPISFTDVAVTLSSLLRLPDEAAAFEGRDLVPLLASNEAPTPRSVALEAFSVDDGHGYQAAWLEYPYKLFYEEENARLRAYQLRRDPAEQRPFEPEREPAVEGALGRFRDFLEQRGAALNR